MRYARLVLLCLFGCQTSPGGMTLPDAATDLGMAMTDAAPRDLSFDFSFDNRDLSPLCGTPACTAGTSCQTAQGCCSCGPFARACLPGWTCAMPAENDPRCPETPPTYLSECAIPDGIACWYCTAGGQPMVARCVGTAGFSECMDAGHTRCWAVAGPTKTCD